MPVTSEHRLTPNMPTGKCFIPQQKTKNFRVFTIENTLRTMYLSLTLSDGRSDRLPVNDNRCSSVTGKTSLHTYRPQLFVSKKKVLLFFKVPLQNTQKPGFPLPRSDRLSVDNNQILSITGTA
jgi:hypothetical protein